MIQIVVIQDFMRRLNIFSSKMVYVYIRHMLYGSQKIKYALRPLWDGERIGIIIDNEEKYITLDELREVYIENDEYHIKSDVMEINIIPITA